jgi:hydroxypyruvate isomerase
MLTLSVCIEMFWPTLPMDERVRRVAALGFSAFEFWGWKNKDLDALRAATDQTGLALAVMCMEPTWCITQRGNDQTIVAGFVETLPVARAFGCTRLIIVPGDALPDESPDITRRRVVRKLKLLAPRAEDAGVTLVIEPLNPIVDHRGVWMTTVHEAVDIVEEVGSPNVKVLDDLYHEQLVEGNLIANLRQYAPWIGHIHTAGAPGRHELIGGEIDYAAIFAAIKGTSYSGYIGLEYRPTRETEAGLKETLALLSPT